MHIMQTFIALLKSRDADDFVEFKIGRAHV